MFIQSRTYLDDEYVAMTRIYFIQYTQQEVPEFRDTLIQHLEPVKKSINKRAQHTREYDSWVNERILLTQNCKVQEVQASNASSGDKDCSRIVSDKRNDQGLENQSNTSGDDSSKEKKMILKQLNKANASLTQELKECKTNLDETNRALGEATSCRDNCLIALQNKQTELEKYIAFNDRTIDYEIIQTKLNDTLGLLALKDIEINEVGSNIHMLAPKCSTYNGRPTFANPKYLKKAQSEKPCLYEIPYDISDLTNRFAPNREETMTLESESRSKFNKDTVKPYDYTQQNSLYEIFKPPSLEYLYQLERAKEVRKTMWRKSDIVDKAWFKHSSDQFRAPTALDMEVLIQTLLIPLSIKTQNDGFPFEHELKHEMHEDFNFRNKLKLLIKKFIIICQGVFLNLKKHTISVELALQQCKEQMKNNSVCKENESNVFRKEREQYHEIRDLKAQMRDKNIAISELKKLIEKFKGKGVDTNLEKPAVLGKPHVDVSHNLTKPVTPHFWAQMKESSLAKPNNVIAPGPFRNHPKHVSFQTPRESVGSNDMVHNYYLEEAKKKAQL
nr:hypothetical protein [Tanacetum cinerariifolium]